MELNYTAEIRPRSQSPHGDDLTDDMHDDYKLVFDESRDYFMLEAREDKKIKSIPLTKQDLDKMVAAYTAFRKMVEVANG